MKKIICVIISFLIIIQGGITVFAANIPTVYSDAVNASRTEFTLVPVKIKDNSGIMGFRINLEYPSDKVDIKSVSRSDITSKGNFISNLGDKDGSFDVLWNNTDNVSEDGTLFVLEIKSKCELVSDVEIKITYNQQDTFNSSYKDVPLVCENILLKADTSDNTQDGAETKSDETKKINNELDSSQIVSTVNVTLNENGYGSLNEVNDKDDFVNDFNKNLKVITGTDDYYVSSFDEIVNLYKTAYGSDFIKEVEDNVDYDDINSIIRDALSEFNADTPENIGSDNKEAFVKSVESKLREKNPDIPEISADVNVDDAAEIIAKLYDKNYNAESKAENEDNSSNPNVVLIFTVIVAVILLSAIAVAIIKKRKSVTEQSEKADGKL